MSLRSRLAFLVAICLVAAITMPLSALAGDRKRIAILPFDYGAVSSSCGAVDVGKGITTMLITQLVKDGTYSIVDRQMLDSLLKEQNFSVSDRADQSSAIKIGKLLSVDAIVVGTVTQFGVEKHSSGFNIPAAVGYGIPGIPYVGGLGSLGSFHSSKAQAKVGIDARIIDTSTGEILATANGTGQSKTKGNWTLNDSWDWSSSDFTQTVAGEAVNQAVTALVPQLTAVSSKIPDNQSLAAQNVKGTVADVTGSDVIVNVGKKNGVKVGDNLQIERVTKIIKDPATGKVLKELTSTIGLINVKEADDDSATGTIFKGNGLKVGDIVRKVTTDVSAVIISPIGTSTSTSAATGSTSTSGKSTHSARQ